MTTQPVRNALLSALDAYVDQRAKALDPTVPPPPPPPPTLSLSFTAPGFALK